MPLNTGAPLEGGGGAADLARARPPILSLMSKSEKARQKLAPGTWQYTMLTENLRALHLSIARMDGARGGAERCSPEDIRAALGALASMIARTEAARPRFPQGTAQHTLLKNRLFALRLAEDLIRQEQGGD